MHVIPIISYYNTFFFLLFKHRLSWLPVVQDEDEAPYVYGYLCDLIEANHVAVLGPNNANLPRLISFFAEALHKDAVSTDNSVMGRILSIVRQIEVCYTNIYVNPIKFFTF